MRPGRGWWVTRLAVGTALITALGAGASAQPGAREATLTETVAALGAADVHARENAMGELATADRFTFSDIEAALKQPGLSGEQRCRLLEAAKERFFSTPRAAMGVQFAQLMNQLPDRVVIGKTFEQFPSAKLLQPGDMIVEVEGVALRRRGAQDVLGAHIISRDPGDKLRLAVRRGEEKLVLDVELGRFSDLPNTIVDPNRVALAWELRSRPLRGQGAVKPVECGMAQERWEAEAMRTPDEIRKLRLKTQMPPLYRPLLVVGGQPRGGAVDPEDTIQSMKANALAAVDPRIWQQQQPMLDPFRGQDGPVNTPEEEVQKLEQALQLAQEQLARRTAPGGRRQDLIVVEADRQRYLEMISLLEKQLVAVRAEAAEKAAQTDKAGGGAPAPGPR